MAKAAFRVEEVTTCAAPMREAVPVMRAMAVKSSASKACAFESSSEEDRNDVMDDLQQLEE